MFLGKTLCGKVILDSYNSRTEVDLSHIKEVIKNTSIHEANNFATVSFKMKRNVGHTIVVPASSNDEIIYAKRTGKDFFSRFVINKKPVGTYFVTLEFSKIPQSPDEWLLQFSYYGNTRAPEIVNSNPTNEQLKYWNTHAFCWGYSGVIPGTVSKKCPWEA
jgi:hypothetical protein